ncbi:hypothetical protein BKA64DRAFT_215650 [Cadophora sp. MPI-SDFR-AT-0126]|nr:hypothetical protein BKA64DRAFT_215650 [Leotiomycetes sp. MPI-SDFR-AT-0126]
MPYSQWPLPFSTESLLSCPNDLSGPWSQLGPLHVATSHFPNETPSKSEIPSNSLAMPGQQGTPASASISSEQSHSESAGNSPQSLTSSPDELTLSSQTSTIVCTWPQCNKPFHTRAAYNHHARYHIMSFQCPLCPKRQATKREHDRHINSVHISREKYYCPVVGCSRAEPGGGGHFSREDGCIKHMFNKHGITGGEMECKMDEQTKKIRRERKLRKRRGH